jgi:hypothetical protein
LVIELWVRGDDVKLIVQLARKAEAVSGAEPFVGRGAGGWVVGAYALTFASLMLACGMIGDDSAARR